MGHLGPILESEFLRMLQRCMPPAGWPAKLAVAHSGGADSTCLLYLLTQLTKAPPPSASASAPASARTHARALPRSIISLTVNHGLQDASDGMAAHCARTARALGVPHRELRVPWGVAPFPARPGSNTGAGTDAGAGAGGGATEGVARDARYHVLVRAMAADGADAIAFGHHADDQVETALMRLARGSSVLGLAGMRRVRRWGMGMGREEGDLGWAGARGMGRWIVRPLLTVGKDRILATCEKAGLEYVDDPSNFQPELTLRNAVRQMLDRAASSSSSAGGEPLALPPSVSGDLPERLAEDLRTIVKAAESADLPIPLDLSGSREELRGAILSFTEHAENIESQASAFISRHSVASPPSTFLFCTDKIQNMDDPAVNAAVLYRILRYVSPAPWGSNVAEGRRRSEGIARLADRLWNTPAAAAQAQAGRHPFASVGKVLWNPIRIGSDGRLRYETPQPYERYGWIASRAPPSTREPNPTVMDVTDSVAAALAAHAHPGANDALEVLYDNRFLLTFRLAAAPPALLPSLVAGHARIVVEPQSRWFWPRVVLRQTLPEPGDTTLASVPAQEMMWYSGNLRRRAVAAATPASPGAEEGSWVDVRFIRVMNDF